jgi:hypothetical protein
MCCANGNTKRKKKVEQIKRENVKHEYANRENVNHEYVKRKNENHEYVKHHKEENVYSPAITAEMLGLPSIYKHPQQTGIIPLREREAIPIKMRNPQQNAGNALFSMLPSPQIMQAMGEFLPRAYAIMSGGGNKLEESMVPKSSSIRHMFADDEINTNASSSTRNSNEGRTHVAHHNIKTPIGNIQISSMIKEL